MRIQAYHGSRLLSTYQRGRLPRVADSGTMFLEFIYGPLASLDPVPVYGISEPERLSHDNVERRALSPQAIAERFGRPAAEVIRLADRHTLAVQQWLSTRAPRAVIFQGRGATATSSGLAVPLLNLALGGQFATADEETVEEEIEAVIAFFKKRQVPWRWWLGPQVRPPDLPERLERHGLTFRGRLLPALAARLPVPVAPADPAIHVWLAADESDLQAASTIRRIAFRFPPGTALDYFEACADDWLGGSTGLCASIPPKGRRGVDTAHGMAGHARLYLARVGDGPPAAIGALIMGAGYPGLYVMATLPDWQRQGLGRAIMAYLMQDANATGHELAFLTASPFGYPLYRQFGFEHIFDYRIYHVKRKA